MTNDLAEKIFKGAVAVTACTFAATGTNLISSDLWPVLFPVLSGLATNVASQFGVEACMPYITKHWLNHPEKVVNHHIQRALYSAISTALTEVEEEYLSFDGVSPKEAKSLQDFFAVLQNRSEQEYINATRNELGSEEVLNYIYQPQEIIRHLEDRFIIHSDSDTDEYYLTNRFTDYFPARFAEKIQFHFRELLKKGEEAKQALDLLFFDTLNTGLETLKADQKEIRKLLDTALQAKAKSLEKLEFYGEIWIGAIRRNRDQLDRIEKNTSETLYFTKEILKELHGKDALKSKYLNTFAHYDLTNLVGRQSHLKEIENHFQQHRLLLLHGIGGIGKTTLAKAYIAQAQNKYQHIAYVEMVNSLAESMLLKLARSLDVDLLIDTGLELEVKFEGLIERLRQIPDLLLVIDNVNDADDLQQRKKQLASLNANVLITGRARPLSFQHERLIQEVESLSPAEAFDLFKYYYTLPLNISDQLFVERMLKDAFYHAKLVEVIAKAAHQANAFVTLEALGQIVGKKQYRDDQINFPIDIDDQSKKIYRVLWDLFNPHTLPETAQQLLRYFAILPSTNIPVQDLASLLQLKSTIEQQALLVELTKLVQGGWLEEENNRYFSMHGLVQWVIRQRLSPSAINCRLIIHGMRKTLFYEDPTSLLSKQHYLLYTNEWLSLLSDNDKELARAYSWIATTYNDLGNHKQALAFHQKSVVIFEKVLPANHPELADAYNNLAVIYSDFGDHAKALIFHQKALTIREAVFPPNHSDLALSYMNIAENYREIGDYLHSLNFHQKALAIQEAELSTNHPDLALSYYNLAETYNDSGDYLQSSTFHQKALAIREVVLSSTHPDLASSYHSLASIQNDLGNHTQALTFHKKALAIREAVLPPNHPSLANSYNNLAATYRDLKDYQQTLVYLQKAAALRESVLPPTHPDLASSYNSLAVTYGDLGDYQQALAFHQKAVVIREEVLPANHPELAFSYHNLARSYSDVGDYEPALSLLEKALAIQEAVLPANHPNLARSYHSIAATYNNLGNHMQALAFYQKAIAIHKMGLPTNQFHLASSYFGLASTYRFLDDYPQALTFFQEAVAIDENVLPDNHPDLANSYSNLSIAFYDLDDLDSSLVYLQKAVSIWVVILSSDNPTLTNARENLVFLEKSIEEQNSNIE